MPFHTIWAYDPNNLPPHTPDMPADLEFLLDDSTGDEWLFRRDPSITRLLSSVVLQTPEGTPYLAPEIALLYKAKEYRPEDNSDFTSLYSILGTKERNWLATALRTCYPQHEWLASL